MRKKFIIAAAILIIVGIAGFYAWQSHGSAKLTDADCQKWTELYQETLRSAQSGQQQGYDSKTIQWFYSHAQQAHDAMVAGGCYVPTGY